MQSSLFDTIVPPQGKLSHKLAGGILDEFPAAFSVEESNQFMALLMSSTPWQEDYLSIAGKKIAVPRLQCWMGDAQSDYGYSGIRLTAVPWSYEVDQIRLRISELAGVEFNSVLLNLYRNGSDSVAWHADDEPELGPDPVIASVSFGCERTFQLKPKNPTRATRGKHEIVLRNGSLVIMKNGIQNNWLHQIPKVRYSIGKRINLTFRTIIN
jgi:alkylated DNA repair dioxygenase AlkB